MEFLRVMGYAKFGLDEDPLQLAYHRARAKPLPEVPGVADERIRLLAAMFPELSAITGGEFFLPTRKVGQLFGISHVIANSWIGGLRGLGFIKRTTPGNAYRSPRYVVCSKDNKAYDQARIEQVKQSSNGHNGGGARVTDVKQCVQSLCQQALVIQRV